MLETRQMKFATVHEQCLAKKFLAWGFDWRIGETKSAFTPIASSWGDNYFGCGKGRAIPRPFGKTICLSALKLDQQIQEGCRAWILGRVS